MNLLNIPADDQLALLGSVLALTVCGSVMSLSFHLGRFLYRLRMQKLAEQQVHEPDAIQNHGAAAAGGDSRGKAA